ncbi:MAG: hypothetical protein ACSLFP_14680 [Acidimicrobiales bacterium]
MTSFAARQRARWTDAQPDVRRYTRAVGWAALAALVAYVAVLWDFGLDPRRTALSSGDFSSFYDIQARAFLDGKLSVPEGALGIEAFRLRGQEFMYFPPGPALFRMPILAVTDGFDGRITALSMLLAWGVTTVVLALLIWRVRRVLRGDEPLSRIETGSYAALLFAITAGSVVLYLGSMPFVYHEAYAWAIATSLGAAHCILGLLTGPPRRSAVIGAALFTLGAVLSRTTAGWACAGALVLTGLWFAFGRGGDDLRRWGPRVALAGLAPLSVGIAFNWAKFRHPYMFPLGDQIWTSVNEQRRLALEANGGDLVSLQIFPSTFVNYLRPDGIRFTSLFPFITLPAEPAQSYGGSFLDQTYRTGSVVAFMPLLTLLSIWGMVTAFRPRGVAGASLLRIPLLGLLAIPGAIMFYGYIAYRYTSELVPVMALASSIGAVDLARRSGNASARRRRATLSVLVALGLFGFAANLAVAVTTNRTNHPGPPLQEMVRVQERLSRHTPGHPFADLVTTSPTLPRDSTVDQIVLVDDCQAAYVGTGEPLSPWVMLEGRELAWVVDVSGVGDRPARITLARADGLGGDGVVLELDGEGRFRALFDTVGRDLSGTGVDAPIGRWRTLPPDGILRLRLGVSLPLMQYVVIDEDNPRLGLVDIKTALPDASWFRQELVMRDALDRPEVPGVEITPVETATLPICNDLRARYAGGS